MKGTLAVKTHFNAAYRAENPNWSEEKNREVFGDYSSAKPPFIAHNFDLIAFLEGEINPLTGRIYDPEKLAALLKKHIENRYDHHNLYLDVDDFSDTVPTSEMIALRTWERMRPLLPEQLSLTIRIYETKDCFAEYSG